MTIRTYSRESDVKAEVRRLLTNDGWYWWMPPANGFGKSNVDFNALKWGRFLAVETKFGTNKPTAMQKQYLNEVSKQQGYALVVTDRTMPMFVQWLAAMREHMVCPTDTTDARLLDALRVLTQPLLSQST